MVGPSFYALSMGESREHRRSLTEEMRLLLGALTAGLRDGWSPEERQAWIDWKESLIARLVILDQREQDLLSEPWLWINEGRPPAEPVSEIEQTERGAPVDVR